MRKAVQLLALITMVSSSPAWAGDLNSEGIKAYRLGEYAKAEQLFRQAISEETDNDKLAAVYRNLGLLYSTQGKDASEFTKRADELNPPAKPVFIRDDGRSVLINNNQTPSTVTREGSDPSKQQLQFSPGVGAKAGAASLGPSVFGSAAKSGFSFGGSGNGGILNGGFVGGSRFDSMPGFSGGNFSSSTPNSNFGYSTNTPIVLPAANGPPVIINSPGPNIFSSQQAPDGSTTVIRKGTY